MKGLSLVLHPVANIILGASKSGAFMLSGVSKRRRGQKDSFTPWGISDGINNFPPPPPTRAQIMGKKGKTKRETART